MRISSDYLEYGTWAYLGSCTLDVDFAKDFRISKVPHGLRYRCSLWVHYCYYYYYEGQNLILKIKTIPITYQNATLNHIHSKSTEKDKPYNLIVRGKDKFPEAGPPALFKNYKFSQMVQIPTFEP